MDQIGHRDILIVLFGVGFQLFIFRYDFIEVGFTIMFRIETIFSSGANTVYFIDSIRPVEFPVDN